MVVLAFPVEPAVESKANPAATEASSPLVVLTSIISVSEDGLLATQLPCVTTLFTCENRTTAALLLTVVKPTPVTVVELAKFSVEAGVTSNGPPILPLGRRPKLTSTLSNATMPPRPISALVSKLKA